MSCHDVAYFRNIIKCETVKLSELCSKWRESSKDSSGKIPEDVEGQIRSTIGQAELLMSQRFKQFEGLIDNCEFNLGEMTTTCDDLDGFWDMIHFQVEDVEQKFQLLQSIQENDWVLINPVTVNETKPRPQTRKTVTATATKTSKATAFAVAARKRLTEAKKQKITNESEEKENQKTFEMPGFFVVNSPIRKKNERQNSMSSPCTPVRTPNEKTRRTPAKNYLPLVSVTQSARKILMSPSN